MDQIEYQNKHYTINQKDEGTLDDRGTDGGTNFILRIKEQETLLNLHAHDDDDDDEIFTLSTVFHEIPNIKFYLRQPSVNRDFACCKRRTETEVPPLLHLQPSESFNQCCKLKNKANINQLNTQLCL